MKIRPLLLALALLLPGSAFAANKTKSANPTYNWTVPFLFQLNPSGSNSTTDANGTQWVLTRASTWTLPQNSTITRMEFTSGYPTLEYGASAPCPVQSSIQLTDGTTTYSLPIMNDGSSLYSDSGPISYSFPAGAKIGVNTDMVADGTSGGNQFSCIVTLGGSVVVSYTTP